ncbi:MAG: UDP-N-acetylmuramate--L-alanine ligase [Pseudomonadota bacterium]
MQFLEKKKIQGNLGAIHFIGLGGIGISGIAEVMHNLGYIVQGSDLAENANTQRLSALGIKTFIGHSKDNIGRASYVVISSAVKPDNPEVIEAMRLNIPVLRRAEMLAELMKFKTSVAISGSHGKTTTTSLVACMFEAAGLAPTVINGGIINNKSTNAYLGSGDYLIAEADESDATFIKIPSTIAVITNIDPEHMDYYHDFDTLIKAFESFVTNLPFYGFAVACIDHKVVAGLVSRIKGRKIITYGIDSDNANVQAFNIRTDINSSTYDVRIKLQTLGGAIIIENITLPTPGRHNVLNSLAAIAIAAELDFGIKVIMEGFQSFQGVKRRFTKTGEWNGVSIIDDYAHHPIEVAATIGTARGVVERTGGKVIAVFQPHRYSRLQSLQEDFSKCFKEADILYLAEVYAAGEQKIEGITSEVLANEVKKISPGMQVEVLKAPEDLPQIISSIGKSGDIVLIMGAGTSTKWAASLPQDLRDREV